MDYLRSRARYPKEEVGKDIIKLWYSKELWAPRTNRLAGSLLDLGEKRIKDMDASGVAMQVICSLGNPSIQLFEAKAGTYWAKKINDELAAAVKKHPDRFIGLASIAPQSPVDAAREIERAIIELGLHGVVIQSHARNKYLDDKKYWVIFETAERLDVPIYIHPIVPSTAMLKAYSGYGFALAGPPHGFATDTSLHVMRLIYSGLFDKYPGLKIVLGHLGEGLPYWLPRLDFFYLKKWVGERPDIQRKPSEYLKTNFTMTTSGLFFQPALMCAYQAMGADKIAFSIDYPFEDSSEAIQFMKEAPIADGDKEKIFHLNAERLFKI